MVAEPVFFTLHRYFIYANRMRSHFDKLLDAGRKDLTADVELRLYMELWYGLLFVVIEGWRELGLQDAEIDALLTSGYVEVLKRTRNGVFHFQKDYFDDRFLDFVKAKGTATWIRTLNTALGRFFLDHLRAPPNAAGGANA